MPPPAYESLVPELPISEGQYHDAAADAIDVSAKPLNELFFLSGRGDGALRVRLVHPSELQPTLISHYRPAQAPILFLRMAQSRAESSRFIDWLRGCGKR